MRSKSRLVLGQVRPAHKMILQRAGWLICRVWYTVRVRLHTLNCSIHQAGSLDGTNCIASRDQMQVILAEATHSPAAQSQPHFKLGLSQRPLLCHHLSHRGACCHLGSVQDPVCKGYNISYRAAQHTIGIGSLKAEMRDVASALPTNLYPLAMSCVLLYNGACTQIPAASHPIQTRCKNQWLSGMPRQPIHHLHATARTASGAT